LRNTTGKVQQETSIGWAVPKLWAVHIWVPQSQSNCCLILGTVQLPSAPHHLSCFTCYLLSCFSSFW